MLIWGWIEFHSWVKTTFTQQQVSFYVLYGGSRCLVFCRNLSHKHSAHGFILKLFLWSIIYPQNVVYVFPGIYLLFQFFDAREDTHTHTHIHKHLPFLISQILKRGRLCRRSSDPCDFPEFCNGTSAYCVPDVKSADLEPCNNNSAYCFQGRCRDRDRQCAELFGECNCFIYALEFSFT